MNSILLIDPLGHHTVRTSTGDIQSVWFTDTTIGLHDFKRGSKVDFNLLIKACSEMVTE